MSASSINPALSIAVSEIMDELHKARIEVNFVAMCERLVERGFSHFSMGDLKSVLREKIEALSGEDA